MPDGPLFASDAVRHHYRAMVVAEAQHRNGRARAFEVIYDKGNAPL